MENEITNNQIYEKLGVLEDLIKVSITLKRPGKLRDIESEVKIRGSMNVHQVRAYLGGVSRPWALELMKRLGKELGFKYIVGDMRIRKPSLIIFSSLEVKRDALNKIKKVLEIKGELTFRGVADVLNIFPKDNWLELVKDYVNELIKSEGDCFYIKDDNKIALKGP